MIRANEYFPQSVTHAGADLDEKLKELGMGVKEFAIRTDKPEKTIIAVIKGDSAITPDMAVQFEQVLKIPAHFWLNRQRQYDESIARSKQKEMIQEAEDWASSFPLKEMLKLKWIRSFSSKSEAVTALFEFFGISSPAAWESLYLRSELKVQFRISLAHTKEHHALSAWLRRGERQAGELDVPDYSEKNFKQALPEIKTVMAKHPKDFFTKLQSLCKEAGVKVVHTPCLPKTPISGATRWLNDTPLIQMSGRYKRNDSFWFTFFHEAGHILLHGKKDIFLENVQYGDRDDEKEEEANFFSQKWVFSESEKTNVLSYADKTGRLTHADVIEFAKEFNT
ncbi:MAG TPA: HigA family addiction module antitoxin, partial [bacterium]|nr:HigA family addiction module antitoxin [bacterium]